MTFLRGKTVSLRPLESEDAAPLAKWMNDPELRRYLSNRFPLAVSDETAWLQSVSAAGANPRDVVLGITLLADDSRILVGTVGLHAIDWIRRRAMTGIMIGPPELRGRGVGTEAKNLLMDYAFGDLNLHALWTQVLADNQASLRALEKQGYRRGGVIRHATFLQNRWCDMVYFDVLKEEWQALREIEAGREFGNQPR